MRYQQVYSSAAFSAINPSGGIITALAFRFETPMLGGDVTQLQIDLSTTSKPVDGLSATFAQNVGTDDTIVYDPGLGVFVGGGPPNYPILVPLNHSFLYNPAAGNLLMDVRILQQNFGPAGQFDASSQLGDPVSRVYQFDVNATTGITDTYGLDTAFIVTPVPEPSTYMLGGFGTLVLLVGRYIQNKTKSRREKKHGISNQGLWNGPIDQHYRARFALCSRPRWQGANREGDALH